MVLRAEGRVFIRAHLRHLRIPLSGFAASRLRVRFPSVPGGCGFWWPPCNHPCRLGPSTPVTHSTAMQGPGFANSERVTAE
jgi:hypothetical protein